MSAEATSDHLVVTPPDRYYGEGPKILWVDWGWGQIENCLNTLRASPVKLIFYTYGPNDADLRWLLDAAYQADIIILNMETNSAADPIKGHMVAWDKCHYFGRKDLAEIFLGYIDDPTGKMLTWVGELVQKRNT